MASRNGNPRATGSPRSTHSSRSAQSRSASSSHARLGSHGHRSRHSEDAHVRGAQHSISLERSVQRKSSVHKRGKHDSETLPRQKPTQRSSQETEYDRLRRRDDYKAGLYASNAEALEDQAREISRKKRRRKHIIISVVATVVTICLIGGGVAFAYLYSINKNLQSNVDTALLSALAPVDTPGEPFYVLLLGTDASAARMAYEGLDEGAYRSDSMMLARVDPKNKKAAIISIPRDTLVEVQGHGKQKINAALAFGGPSLAVQTVSRMAGVPITHYAEVNFDGFAEMVDALDGIDVDVPIDINDDEAGGSLKAGRQTLDGHGALILCRTRHTYDKYGAGDLYRAANQRLVLSAIAQKMLSVDPLSLGKSVSTLSEFVTTDLDVATIVAYAQSMQGIDAGTDIYTAIAPTSSEYINKGWYEILDETAWKNMISRMEEGLPPVGTDLVDLSTGTVLSSAGGKSEGFNYKVNTATTIRLRNGSGETGVCEDALQKLKDVGYVNISTGNADNFNYEETLVIYKKDSQKTEAEALAKFLSGKAVKDNGKYLFESNYLIVIGADYSL